MILPCRSAASFAQRVDEAIARAKASAAPLSSRITSPLSPSAALALEDAEDWLSLDEQGLEEMLRSRGPGASGLEDLVDDEEEDEAEDDERDDGMEGVEGEGETLEQKEERKARKAAMKLEGMASKVQEFVQGRGAVDGAEFSE